MSEPASNAETAQKVAVKRKGRPSTGVDVMISVRLPTRVIQEIDQLAFTQKRNRSRLIRSLLTNGLELNRMRRLAAG